MNFNAQTADMSSPRIQNQLIGQRSRSIRPYVRRALNEVMDIIPRDHDFNFGGHALGFTLGVEDSSQRGVHGVVRLVSVSS
jgi:hypothetical protein